MTDVKELHIGSHIRIGGKMHRVCAIDGLNEQIGIEAYKTDTGGVKHPFGYKIGDITPIPLTAELLTEIGFEHIDKTLYVKHFDVSHIALSFVGNGFWRVQEYDDVVCHGTMLCRYLHELESFVYMALHKELIEE